MKYLKSFNESNVINKDIISECQDILLELSDIGYSIEINDITSRFREVTRHNQETLEIIVTTRPEKFDWDKWKDSVSDEELIMVKREKLRECFYSLYEDEVEPVIKTVKRYLASKGYNIPIETTPEEYLKKAFFKSTRHNKMFIYRFYFSKVIYRL